jgi:hypothetical protein
MEAQNKGKRKKKTHKNKLQNEENAIQYGSEAKLIKIVLDNVEEEKFPERDLNVK